MKILVTGGAGYLGSIIVPELLKHGHEVTVLDNFMHKQNSLADCCCSDRFSVVRGDCREEGLMRKLLKTHDMIIPLAALVGAPQCSRDVMGATTTNLDAVRLIVKLCSKTQAILYPSTNSLYGVGETGRYCTEESPLNPISLYGTTKVEAEKAVLDRENAISFRFATVFGMSPRMRVDLLVNDFVYRAANDRAMVIFEGHFRRNFIHIRDVARVIIHTINNFEDMRGKPYNVGIDDANLSKIDLCKAIQKHLPKFIFFEAQVGEDPDKRDYIVSNQKIADTGFKTAYSLNMGIKELIKGYTILRNSVYSNV
ncbi:MAG TPA: NAD(P)-dependent oxidoreductase [Desulfatiglandales bacterium]|nr:NAD(P)-dependent oxidoreductase [Desulfatiglandales bacterium]